VKVGSRHILGAYNTTLTTWNRALLSTDIGPKTVKRSALVLQWTLLVKNKTHVTLPWYIF
jgi:hypothetical protein